MDSSASDSGSPDDKKDLSDSKCIAKKRSKNSEIELLASAIRDSSNSVVQAEVTKERILYMRKDSERRERESNFNEWEPIQTTIRALRIETLKEGLDDEIKQELIEDVNGLKKRKLELGQMSIVN